MCRIILSKGVGTETRDWATTRLLPQLVIMAVGLFQWSAPCYAEDRELQFAGNHTFPVKVGEPLLISAEVFDGAVQLLVDTGTTPVALDETYRDRLGDPVSDATMETFLSRQPQIVNRFAIPRILVQTVPQFVFEDPITKSIGCLNLEPPKQALGIKRMGILGMHALRPKILRVDFDAQIGAISDQPTLQTSHREQLRFNSKGLPEILIRLPNLGFRSFMIDTGGSSTICMEPTVFDELLRKGHIVNEHSLKTAVIGGSLKTRVGRISSVEFGPHRFHNLKVSECSRNTIGLPFLSRFKFEFDFPNRVAKFAPGRLIKQEDRRRLSGCGVRRLADKTFVYAVEPDGLADQAGLQNDAEINQINEIPVDRLTTQKIRELMSVPKTELRLTVIRDGKEKEIVLNLPDDPLPCPAKSTHELIEQGNDFDP